MKLDEIVDDCLLLIFKLVNLNDRASLRLVSRRFRAVCDHIPINKLIVFERMAVETGKLQYTNELYDYEDTASCFDLPKLFQNQALLKQMAHLRVLAITGTRLPATQFDLTKFDELNYLSLNQVLMDSPKILHSPKLKHLVIDQVYMKTVDELNERMAQLSVRGQSFKGETISIHMFGFDHLRSKHLKYLKLRGKGAPEFEFFDYCARNKLFDSLDELDVMIDDLRSILVAAEHCPNLNAINAITPHGQFFNLTHSTDMRDFFARIQKSNLKVYFFGIEFNQRSISELSNFVEQFEFAVQVDNLECRISKPLLETIKKLAKNYDLNRFYRMISQVSFRLPCGEFIEEAGFLRKLVNTETLYFDLDDHPDDGLFKFIDCFPKLRCLRIGIHGLRDYNMSNKLLKEIPKRCPRILVFMLDCKDPKTNFDFLFEFQQLSTIILNASFAFDQSTYVKLIRKLKGLFRLDVRYVAASNVNRDELRSFKRLVVSCIEERPSSNHLDFKLNIHTKKSETKIGDLMFVRCHFKPKLLDCIIEEEEKLFHWSRLIQMKAAGFVTSIMRMK